MENENYSSKELVKMIYDLKIELTKTQTLIKTYNGLREQQADFMDEQNDIKTRLKTVEDCLDNKEKNTKNYQWLIGIVIGIVIAIISKFL